MVFKKVSLEDRVVKAKNDKDEINKLISEFKPFIAGVAQKKVGKFLSYGVDDELSIGLIAFKEAVDSYDGNRGKFLSFAKLVISMRLIDYYRRQSGEKIISLEADDDNSNEVITDIMDGRSMEQYKIDDENEKRILEIIEYREELQKWGISLEDLVKVSPRKESLRNHYRKVAEVIVENNNILNILLKTKRLPIREIEEIILIHRKKLERGRIYIIAMVIAMLQNFSYIETCRGDGWA